MLYRTILRNEAHQVILEQQGAVVIPFLVDHNVEWILEMASELAYELRNEVEWSEQTKRLDSKLRSKVEYRCINCEPFHYELVSLSDLRIPCDRTYRTFTAVTNELRHPSLRFIVPLSESRSPICMNYLPKAHSIITAPRVDERSDDFSQFESEVTLNMRTLQVKPLEAVVLFSSVPFVISTDSNEYGALALIITVLPYEADANVILPSVNGRSRTFKMHRCKHSDYVKWLCGDCTSLDNMRPVFDVEIPDVFKDASAEIELFGSRENGGTFVLRLMRKLSKW
jgi:hypothetical protein